MKKLITVSLLLIFVASLVFGTILTSTATNERVDNIKIVASQSDNKSEIPKQIRRTLRIKKGHPLKL